jgi:polyhydroxybutyrate depolymerase
VPGLLVLVLASACAAAAPAVTTARTVPPPAAPATTSPAATPTPPVVTATTTPTPRAAVTAGCPRPGRSTLVVAGRAVLAGVPQTPAKPPLVLALAGYDQSRQDLDRVSHLVDRARDRGVAAVLLEGTGRPLAWAYQSGQRTDVRFAERVLDRLRPCVDLKRLVLLGFSDGGLIGMRLACDLGPAVRHFVMLSASVAPEQGCRLPVDIGAVHGTDDPFDPYGGNDRGIPPARAAMLAWAQAAGCARVTVRTTAPGVEVRSYPPCPVALTSLVGGGHAWPGGEPSANPHAGPVFRGYDLTAALLAVASS